MTWWRRGVVGLAVLALVVFGVVRLVSSNGADNESDRPSLESLVVPSSGAIRWSPDATKVAFVVDRGLTVVRVEDAQQLGRTGAAVVDAAWMPDARRLVLVEGPIPTGQVVAVGTDGRVQGTTALRPSIAFGEGLGLAVNSRGTQAAAIATTREPIGGATRRDVAVVDLQTGVTRVFVDEQREESNPLYVDDATLVYAADVPGRLIQLRLLDLTTGAARDLGVVEEGPHAVLASGEVVVGRRAGANPVRLFALDVDGGSRELGVVPRGMRVVAVDRFGTRAMVRTDRGPGGARVAIVQLTR